MPAHSIRYNRTKSQKIAFQFASGRTQMHAVITGASGDQMVYSFFFGLRGRVLWTSSAKPLSTCLQCEWWLLRTWWYLPSFCHPTHYAEQNDSNEVEGTRCQGRKKLWSRTFTNRLLFRPQPGLVRRPGMNRSAALLWNISGSCIYSRCPLPLLSDLSVGWLNWLAHLFFWGWWERELKKEDYL